MVFQPSRAAGSSAGPLRADHSYSTVTAAMEIDDGETSPTWHAPLICSEDARPQDRLEVQHKSTMSTPFKDILDPTDPLSYSSSSSSPRRNFTEELAGLLTEMCSGQTFRGLSGEDLAEAFCEASDFPPVTRQSLGELDIQSIITNIRLRHDVNFDRDLSFRPNLDGAKGQEKGRVAKRYWTALVAELILYERLYQGSPPLHQTNWEEIARHAQRRIPILFQTVRDVLKSLVPDRDHTRVDEHLDIPMLMQAIGRGVCDLVRLAEWMAHLLKEHCAPMRDVWVDSMVDSVRAGVNDRSPETLVEGLRGLLGILEAMKLDVANHQIRNLKTLLVEDTINFEKHYHLDRLVHGRPRVNIAAAQAWFSNAVEEFSSQCAPEPRNVPRFQLEVFVRSISAVLFGKDGRTEFPDTLYLDQERLKTLRAEIEDLICFDICMDMFVIVVKQLGYENSISLTTGQQLRTAISAIMNEGLGHGPQQWMMNSEELSLELLRQASRLLGHAQTRHFDRLSETNQHLRHLLLNKTSNHSLRLEASILPQILNSAQRHIMSSPMDLFTSLVSTSPCTPPPPAYVPPLSTSDTLTFAHLHPEAAKMTDLANRIIHIIVLHWRVWERIAYVPEEDTRTASPASTKDQKVCGTSLSRTHSVQPTPAFDHEPSVVASLRTGDQPEAGTEAHRAHKTSSQ
ncbi:Protein SOSEKI 1 [Coniothyrium glycines]